MFGLTGAGDSMRRQQRRLDQKRSRFRDRRTWGVRGSGLKGFQGHLRRSGWREKVGTVENPSETGCRHGREDDRARKIWRGPSHADVSEGKVRVEVTIETKGVVVELLGLSWRVGAN